MKTRVSAIILAGGQSRRFNYDDKGLIEWQGKPLIEQVISRLVPQTDEIIINCNQHKDSYSRLGYTLCQDQMTGFQGPMAGIQAALPLAKYDYALVSPCDTPLLPDSLVDHLLNAMLEQSADIAYAINHQRQHYLPVLLKTSLSESINQYLSGNERSMQGWYSSLNSIAVPFEDDAAAFSNINSPEDLQA